jgi:hypothetical protein
MKKKKKKKNCPEILAPLGFSLEDGHLAERKFSVEGPPSTGLETQ